ncbi:MAG TPA: PepSY domain-containing protein [Acetobacteraceae bacterium]|nr:PepSY domain-containing protein [Acetobacteraceae bacterium]
MTRSPWRSFVATAALAATITATASGAFASQEREAGCRMQSGATALTDQEIRGKLTAQGFTEIRSIGREDGCVEAKGIDKEGKRFEVYLHPATGEIVSRK